MSQGDYTDTLLQKQSCLAHYSWGNQLEEKKYIPWYCSWLPISVNQDLSRWVQVSVTTTHAEYVLKKLLIDKLKKFSFGREIDNWCLNNLLK